MKNESCHELFQHLANIIFCLWQQMMRHLEEPIKIQIESDFKTAGFAGEAFSSLCCFQL